MNPDLDEPEQRVRKTKIYLEEVGGEDMGDDEEPERKVAKRSGTAGHPCQYEAGCTRAARGVGPNGQYCKRHGGGKRCQYTDAIGVGCSTSAEGKSPFCIKHGGGRRCEEPDCNKASQGKTTKCSRHGGGMRCTWPECTKGSFNKSLFCAKHGGGPRCQVEGCDKASRGSSGLCFRHRPQVPKPLLQAPDALAEF